VKASILINLQRAQREAWSEVALDLEVNTSIATGELIMSIICGRPVGAAQAICHLCMPLDI
jgi:hypothetical protein